LVDSHYATTPENPSGCSVSYVVYSLVCLKCIYFEVISLKEHIPNSFPCHSIQNLLEEIGHTIPYNLYYNLLFRCFRELAATISLLFGQIAS